MMTLLPPARSRSPLSLLVAALFLSLAPLLPAQLLLNVDFGSGTNSAKVGFAGTGLATNDFWNLYSHYRPRFSPGMPFQTNGSLANLLLADHSASTVSLTVSNAPGIWGNASGDPMFDSFLYPHDGSNLTVTISNLAPGHYHFFLYGHADPDGGSEQNGVFTLHTGTNVFGPRVATPSAGWKATQPWQEDRQFVVFRDVPVSASRIVTVQVAPGAHGVAVLNGLQILSRGTSPPRTFAGPVVSLPATYTNLIVRSVRYEGKVSDHEARFSATLEVESLTTNEVSAILFEGDVAVFTPDLPAGLRLTRAGDFQSPPVGIGLPGRRLEATGTRTGTYRLHCAKPGIHSFKVEVIAKITRAEPWGQVAFSGPPAAVASMKAEGETGMELELLSGAPLETVPARNATGVAGVIGADRLVSLRWQNKTSEITRKSLLTVDTTASAQVTPTVIKFTTQLRYELLQASVPKLTLRLPAGHTLTRVQGDGIRDWRTAAEPGAAAGGSQAPTLLTVEFAKPVEKIYTLTLFTEVALDATPVSAGLRVPEPLAIERESGTFTIATDDTVVEVESVTGVRQVNATGGALLAWRFNSRPAVVTARIRRIEPVLHTAARVGIRLEETRLVITHALNLDVQRAGIYSAEFSVPPGFNVTEARGARVEDWKVVNGRLRVNFSQRVLGMHRLDLTLEQAHKTFPPQIEIAAVRLAGAEKETAFIGAAAAPGIRLKTGELTNAREIPVVQLGQRTGDEMLAFTADLPDWKLTLAPERLPARIVAEVFNLVTIGDGLVGGSATIRYGLINQGVQEFTVRVPAHWKNLEFTGPNIRRKEQQTNLWTISLQDKAWSGYTLVVTYDYQFDPKQAALDLAGAHCEGVERETGSVAITTAASLQLKPQPAVAPLRVIDQSELAETDRALVTRPVLLAYRYTGGDFQLGASAVRFDEERVLDAVADRTQITSVITEAGEMLTQASFMVKNSDRQFQKFILPTGAHFWGCYVNNQPSKADQEGPAILISLPRGVNRDEAFAVDLIYAQKVTALQAGWFPQSVALAAPATDIPNTYAEWEIFLPATRHVTGFGGTMSVARGTTYGLREAWLRFLNHYENFWGQSLTAVLVLVGLYGVAYAIRRQGSRAIITVLVVVVITGIMAAMLLPALSTAKGKASRIKSVNNLKQIGLAAKVFANDNGDRFPTAFEEMRNELGTDKVLLDPESGQIYEYVGAGKPVDAPQAIIAYSPLDVNGRNVVFADGSVQQLTSQRFAAALVADAQVVAAATVRRAQMDGFAQLPAARAQEGGRIVIGGQFSRGARPSVLAPGAAVADGRSLEEKKSEPASITARSEADATRQRESGLAREDSEVRRKSVEALAARPGMMPPAGEPSRSFDGGETNSTMALAGTNQGGRVARLDVVGSLSSPFQLSSVATPAPPTTAAPLPPPPAEPLVDRQNLALGFGAISFAGGGADKDFVVPIVRTGGTPSEATAAGLRSIRIDIPRSGQSFTFTKVLNLKRESLGIEMTILPKDKYRLAQSAGQLGLFLFGLLWVWRHWRRVERSSFHLTVGLVLAASGVIWLGLSARTLHWVLVAAVPSAGLIALAWLAWKLWPARRNDDAGPPEPPSGTGTGTPVSTLALIALLSAAGSPESPAQIPVRSTAVTVTSAGYTGTVREQAAEFSATLVLNSQGTNQTVLLFGDDVAIQSFTAKPPEARLVREGRSVSVWLPNRGAVTIDLKLLVRLGGDVTKRRLAFGLPPALASQFSAVIGEEDAEVEFPTAVAFRRTTQGKATRVDATIGSADRVELVWTPRLKRIQEMDATVFAQTSTLVTVGGGVLNTRALVDYQIAQGELRQARVRLPAGQRLLRVEGEGIRTWELVTEGGAEVLSVDLLKGVSANWRLKVETEAPLAALPATVSVPVPHALEVRRTSGLVAVRGAEEVSLTVDTAEELQRVDTAEFLRASGEKTPDLVSAFRYLTAGFRLAVRAEAVRPQIEVAVRNQLRVGAEQLALVAQLDYLVKQAGIFQVRLAIPAGWRLESVLLQDPQRHGWTAIANWTEKTEAGQRILEVPLKERTLGRLPLVITLAQTVREVPRTLAVPAIHPLGVQKITGAVSVAVEAGLAVKTSSFDGLTEIPAAALPGVTHPSLAQTATLAFKFLATEPASTPAWQLTIATEQLESWVRAEILNLVSVSETLLSGRALVRLEIANAPLKEFQLRIPLTVTNVDISGANIRRRDQTGEVWRVELQNKIRGTHQFTVTWEQPRAAGTNTALAVPGVSAVGVERETGAVALLARPPLQVTGKSASGELVRIDPRELPAWAAGQIAGTKGEAVVLAWRYLRPGWSLAAESRRFEEAAVLQALVDNARLTSVVGDDGQMMTEVRLAVRNNGRQFLEMELPAGATVWSAFVAGQPVRPSRQGSKLLLPLERSLGDDGVMSVEFTYVGSEKFPRRKGAVALASPRFDVPVKNARWELLLPPDYEFFNFEGTMSREVTDTAVGYADFSHTEYARQERKNREERVGDQQSAASNFQSMLSSGNLKDANAYFFNNLRNPGSDRGPVLNEADGRQLQEAEVQLRRALSSNLVQAQQAYSANNDLRLGDPVGQGGQGGGNPAAQGLVYDERSAEQQWLKLQKAQEVTVAQVQPLRVNLPTRGQRHAFTQVLNTDLNRPLTVEFSARNLKVAGWGRRMFFAGGAFMMLWIAVTLISSRRRA